MAIRLAILAWFLAWFLPALWPDGAAANERRLALVVGVANYKHAPRLANTHNDARSMTDALKRLGFEVEQLLDPDRAMLETGVRNLRQRGRGADAALFFYAGHALELAGRNWLLPVGADLQSDRDLRFEGLDLDSILEQLEGSARVSLVFLDSCRDNPFRVKVAGGTRDAPSRGLARVTSGFGTLIAFSTAPGTVAQDGAGPNSPFTAALVKRIETPGLELRRMLSQIRVDVREATSGRQVPWENSALEGDFFFRGLARVTTDTPPTQPPPSPSPSSSDREVVFWNSIAGSRDPADFRAYLAQFPQGVFAELARNRITQLQAALTPPPSPAPAPSAPPPAVPSPGGAAGASAAIAPPSSLRDALASRLAAASTYSPQGREDLSRNYEQMTAPKGLAVVPGTSKSWRFGRLPSEGVADRILEACQVYHGQPCAMLAVNDRVEPGTGEPTPRDMPRARYAGRYDPERVPAARPDVLARPDVAGYAKAPLPKAAAYHASGRLFTATGAKDQRGAEEQALAACNADPDRRTDSGPCFLYAVGNKVVLTQRFAAPRPPARSISEAAALMSPDRNLPSNYAAQSSNKALAMQVEAGRPFWWDSLASTEEAERLALEGCQFTYRLPCILVATNDELKAADPYAAPARDMPNVSYEGKFRVDKVPLRWRPEVMERFKSYPSARGHKAIAMRAVRPSLHVAVGAKSVAEAERQALEGCNGNAEFAFPCFLYAVDDRVILPQRRSEPRP